MQRSTFIALVIGAFGGLGAQWALAQPVDANSGKVRNLTVTNSLAVGNDLTVSDDLTVTGDLKTTLLDAGAANVANNLTVGGAIVALNSAEAIILNSGTGRVVFGGSGGNYLTLNGASGRVWSTGGLVTSNYALGAAPGGLMDSSTAPTIANGCTGEAMAWNNGSANFEFDVGTSCTGVSTMVITLPAVGNCWNCQCWNVTGRRNIMQSACSTTTATVTNMGTSVATPADWTDSDNVQCMCRGG